MRPRIRTSASLLCYLCLPGILALWTAPNTGVSLSVGSLMQTTILVVGITSAAEIWLPRQPRLGRAVIAGFVHLLFLLRAGEVALATMVGRTIDPLVLAHTSRDAIGYVLADHWAPVAISLVIAMSATVPVLRGLRAVGHAPAGAPSYTLRAVAVLAVCVALLVGPVPGAGELASGRLAEALAARRSPIDLTVDLELSEYAVLNQLGIQLGPRAGAPQLSGRPEHPPNLIVILLESFNANFSRAGGSRLENLTPRLDRFADRHTYVANAYNAVTPTITAMVSLLCGIIPFEDLDGMHSEPLRDVRCLPDLLREAGYHQVFLGAASKAFGGKGNFLLAHGYDQVFGKADWGRLPRYREWPGNPFGIHDTDLAREAVIMLQSLRQKPPFHLTLLNVNSHMPGYLAPDCPRYHPSNSYLNGIHCSDHAVGELLDAIESLGLLEDTVVVVVGDHVTFPNPRARSALGADVASSFYGRVFMAISAPGGDLPARIETATYSPDLAPTVLDLLGYRVEPGFVLGKSLLGERRSHQRLLARDVEIAEGEIRRPAMWSRARVRCPDARLSEVRAVMRPEAFPVCERLRLLSRVDRWLRTRDAVQSPGSG